MNALFSSKPLHASLLLVIALVWVAWKGANPAQAQLVPDRRAEQFPTEPGYLVLPLPYSMPGLGEGIFWMGHFTNAFETTADITAIYATGDVKGPLINLGEVPIIPNFLLFDGFASNLNSASINIYPFRGMTTGKDDYILVELNKVQEKNAQLTATLFDRRLNLYTGMYTGDVAVIAFRDAEGNLIQEFDTPMELQFKSSFYGAQLDITDSFQDPRKGFRMKTMRTSFPAASSIESDVDTVDYNLQAYIPVGKISALVVDYYQSDATVTREGVTDPAAVQAEVEAQSKGRCEADSAVCEAAVAAQVQNTIDGRKNGTATSLGGRDRLRAYPQGRFAGGHMAFYGVEFRWNLTEETTPFDYFIWKDVRTGIQWAFFAETGTVSETSEELWDQTRNAYGTGIRLVTASGSVYRADLGFGDEGSEQTVFFFYPW